MFFLHDIQFAFMETWYVLNVTTTRIIIEVFIKFFSQYKKNPDLGLKNAVPVGKISKNPLMEPFGQ